MITLKPLKNYVRMNLNQGLNFILESNNYQLHIWYLISYLPDIYVKPLLTTDFEFNSVDFSNNTYHVVNKMSSMRQNKSLQLSHPFFIVKFVPSSLRNKITRTELGQYSRKFKQLDSQQVSISWLCPLMGWLIPKCTTVPMASLSGKRQSGIED